LLEVALSWLVNAVLHFHFGSYIVCDMTGRIGSVAQILLHVVTTLSVWQLYSGHITIMHYRLSISISTEQK